MGPYLKIGGMPDVIKEDDNQGLILGLDYHKNLGDYCTKWMRKSNNKSAQTPKKKALANTSTLMVINGLGDSSLNPDYKSLVISSDIDREWYKYAFPKWRHTNHKIRAIYIQKALAMRAKEQGRTQYAITMKFTPNLALKIIKNGGSSYIQARLSEQLKRSLGYSPDIWVQLEAVSSEKPDKNDNYTIAGKGSVSRSHGVLHMHGVIALNECDLDAVRLVVRNLNRSTSSVFKNHELDLTRIQNERGWVDYCNKHPVLNKILMKDLKAFSRTKLLGSSAQNIYEKDRENLRRGLNIKI